MSSSAGSRSPRKRLRRVEVYLKEFFDTCNLYPEARADVVAAIGEDGWRELEAARASVQRALEALDRSKPGSQPAGE